MTCPECEIQIFDGELDAAARAHLAGCPACRALEAELRLNLSALSELREEVIPERRARRWPWVAAVAAVAVAAAGLALRPAPVAPLPAVAVALPAPPPVLETVIETPPPPAPVAAVRKPRTPRPAAVLAETPPPPQPMLIKFFTEDPNIVIYWIVDPIEGDQAL
jgi:hypothetical protein